MTALSKVRSLISFIGLTILASSGCQTGTSPPADFGSDAQRLEFTRMIVHWTRYVEPGYLDFVQEAEPEIAQVGFYGADFWSIAHLPDRNKGVTGPLLPIHAGVVQAQDPAERIRLSADYFEEINRELKQRGVRPIGHFSVAKYLLGRPDAEGRLGDGFFKFYNELWDENELGPKPVADPLDLLSKNRDGTPYVSFDGDAAPYGVYWGCLSNPDWRRVLKAWVKRGIERGLDGFQINYFYRVDCHCRYCVRGFKAHLASRYDPEELRRRFGIEDLEAHEFSEIVSRHPPSETTPLRLEMQLFSDLVNKEAFDEVFHQYGRSLKPDLITSVWGHSSQDFGNPPTGNNDERMMLPSELWGKDESYLWYCLGRQEPTLQLRYIRGAFDDKPYTVCHYENVKIRASMAELMANGGAPMARYIDFTDPAARTEFIRYYQFLKRYDSVFRGNRPYGEVLLAHPRSQNHQGRLIPAMTAFQKIGHHLMDRHVLFDVIPDEIIRPEQRSGYRRVYEIDSAEELETETFSDLSRFEAPTTVRVSASRPAEGGEVTLHFVNYDREPGPEGYAGTGIADENPIAVSRVGVDFVVPDASRVVKVEALSPEQPEPQPVDIRVEGGRLRFTMPEFLVYGMARIHLEPVLSARRYTHWSPDVLRW